MATSMAKGACRSPSAEHTAMAQLLVFEAAAQVLMRNHGLHEMARDVLAWLLVGACAGL